MPALDGLRAWLESSAILDEAHFKELECYAVKHIANFRTVTAFVESTLDHYFQVCFELPDDLEDGVNVDIEIDGVLCAEVRSLSTFFLVHKLIPCASSTGMQKTGPIDAPALSSKRRPVS